MSTRPKSGSKVSLIAATVVILGGFTYLVYGGIGENLVYFFTPTEVVEKGDAVLDAPIRLGGMVAPGTVDWNPETLDLRFQVTDGETTLEVHSKGAPPQMFRDGIGVVVEGRFTRAGIFESTNVMVKHSNEYRPPAEGQHPEQLYESLLREEAE